MQVLATGKNIDIGDALREHLSEKLAENVGKYFDGAVRAHVTVEKQRSGFSTDCTLHLSTGLTLQAHGEAGDAYASFDLALDHLETRLRRYKRRLKNHHMHRKEPVAGAPAARYVIEPKEESDDDESGEVHDLNPAIIAEDSATITELTVGEAVMQLDISNQPFVLFRNAGHGELNVVYRRKDGHIGWVDPAMPSGKQ